MMDDLIPRVEQQLSAIITAGSGDVSECTIRDHGQRIVDANDIEALIARVRALEAQAAADARVVDAARRYVESIDGLSELYRRDAKQYTFEEDVLFRQISRDWRGVMLAALAARKEEA